MSTENPFGYCNQYIYITDITSEEWLRITDEYNEVCKMSNFIGSKDGKLCHIKCSPKSDNCILIKNTLIQ